jgi:hypothetical protein
MGVLKVKIIGPPSSNITLTPEFGGNSNSFREIPAVKAVELEKVTPRPENCVVTTSESDNVSKSIVTAPRFPVPSAPIKINNNPRTGNKRFAFILGLLLRILPKK